jgi:hypothetical protein
MTVPTLVYGRNSNLLEFKKKLINYAEHHYGMSASFLRTGEYFSPPFPEVGVDFEEEDINGNDIQSQLQRQHINAVIVDRQKLMSKIRTDRMPIFALMWSSLSPESEEIIRQYCCVDNDNWHEIDQHDDPLLLWAVINNATHGIESSGQPLLDRFRATEQFNNIKQGKAENIIAFKERFDAAIASLRLCEAIVPQEQDLAMCFVEKLDMQRYAGFRAQLHNMVMMGAGEYPATTGIVNYTMCTGCTICTPPVHQWYTPSTLLLHPQHGYPSIQCGFSLQDRRC